MLQNRSHRKGWFQCHNYYKKCVTENKFERATIDPIVENKDHIMVTIYHILQNPIYDMETQGVHVHGKEIQRLAIPRVTMVNDRDKTFYIILYIVRGEYETTQQGERQGKGNTQMVMMGSSKGGNMSKSNEKRETNDRNWININPEVELYIPCKKLA